MSHLSNSLIATVMAYIAGRKSNFILTPLQKEYTSKMGNEKNAVSEMQFESFEAAYDWMMALIKSDYGYDDWREILRQELCDWTDSSLYLPEEQPHIEQLFIEYASGIFWDVYTWEVTWEAEGK